MRETLRKIGALTFLCIMTPVLLMLMATISICEFFRRRNDDDVIERAPWE